jgi:hypothetical protein
VSEEDGNREGQGMRTGKWKGKTGAGNENRDKDNLNDEKTWCGQEHNGYWPGKAMRTVMRTRNDGGELEHGTWGQGQGWEQG